MIPEIREFHPECRTRRKREESEVIHRRRSTVVLGASARDIETTRREGRKGKKIVLRDYGYWPCRGPRSVICVVFWWVRVCGGKAADKYGGSTKRWRLSEGRVPASEDGSHVSLR